MVTRAVLVLVPLAAAALRADAPLAWSPPPGADLVAEHSLEFDFELQDASIALMGGEQDPGDFIEGFDEEALSPSGTLALATRDSFLRLPLGDAHDGPLGFVRDYGALTLDDDPIEPLPEGVRVRFERGDDGWERFLLEAEETDGGEEDDELAALREDVGYRWLVPGEALEPEATWSVELDGQGLLDLLVGGLDTDGLEGLIARYGDDVDVLAADAAELLDELADGASVECTLEALDEDDEGRAVARVAIVLEHSGSCDVSRFFEDVVEFSDGEETISPDVTAEFGLELDARGELVWNLDDGCFAAFALETDLEAELTVDVVADLGFGPLEGNALFGWTGTLERAATGTTE